MSLIDSPAFRWMSGWCPKAQWGTAEWDHISVPPSWELGSFFWSYTKPMSVWLVRVGKGTARRVALPDVKSVRSSLWCIEQHWSPRCILQHNLCQFVAYLADMSIRRQGEIDSSVVIRLIIDGLWWDEFFEFACPSESWVSLFCRHLLPDCGCDSTDQWLQLRQNAEGQFFQFDTANPPCQTTGYYPLFSHSLKCWVTEIPVLEGDPIWGFTSALWILWMSWYDMMCIVGCLNLQHGVPIGSQKTQAQGASVEDQGMAVLELTKAGLVAGQMDRDGLMEWEFHVFFFFAIWRYTLKTRVLRL